VTEPKEFDVSETTNDSAQGDVHLLTVDELISVLSELTPEQRALPVELEGCDCSGPAIGIDADANNVLITRGQQIWDDERDEMVWQAIP